MLFLILPLTFLTACIAKPTNPLKIISVNSDLSLQEALTHAKPGTEILLYPGIYKGPFNVEVKAKEKSPLIIRGQEGVLIDGKATPHKNGGACIKIKDAQWIELRNISFKNCWSTSIKIESSQHLIFSQLNIEDSRHAIKAVGEKTQHITLENSTWNQDPSGKLWREISWGSAHHGKHSYFNGALFSSDGIMGDIVIRRNKIRNAYNGIRMKGRRQNIKTINANVEIYENEFFRIRDNPIEPEISAYNWWIHHNKIHNAHAWISLTELTGGEIYIFGNVGWNDEGYGLKGDHDDGTVLKFENSPPFPTLPIYTFHNSWYITGDYIRPKTPSKNIFHYNNALFLTNKKASTLTEKNYDSTYVFENDLVSSSVTNFAKNKWKNLVIANPRFGDPLKGDFSLTQQSPAIDQGKLLQIGKWKSQYDGKAPDIGAYEGQKPFQGPTFKRR